MYITNNKITTNLDLSSSIELLNKIKFDLFSSDVNLLNFDLSNVSNHELPRLYVMESNNIMHFIEFYKSEPDADTITSLKNYCAQHITWTNTLFNVTVPDALSTRINKVFTNFATAMGSDIDERIESATGSPLYDAKTTIGTSLDSVDLTDIDSETAKTSWTDKELRDLGIFMMQASGSIPYDLIKDDVLVVLSDSSAITSL